MAETSSAAFNFNCAVNWDSQSTLSELLTEIKNTNSTTTTTTTNKKANNLPTKQQQLIRNGNGVDEEKLLIKNNLTQHPNQHLENAGKLIKKKSTSINLDKTTKLTSKSSKLIEQDQHDSNSTIKENNLIFNQTINSNQLNNNNSKSNQSSNLDKRLNVKDQKQAHRDDIKFKVGFKLEACDSLGTWYPAKIVALNEKEEQVLIHFIKWSKKYDQWLGMNSNQLRASSNEVNDSENDSLNEFTVGKLVFASWSDNKKYPGHIRSITSDGNFNIQFLDGYRKKVKKSLIELAPADFQLNANLPIDQSTADGKAMITNDNSLVNSNLQQTNGSSNNLTTTDNQFAAVNQQVLLNQSTSTQPKPLSKKRSTDHLVATKEFVIKEDHNQFKCVVENCNKSFRKEKFLNHHIKHYHPEDFKRLGLEIESSTSYYLDDSLSNDPISLSTPTSAKKAINENSETSLNEHHPALNQQPIQPLQQPPQQTPLPPQPSTPKTPKSSKKNKEPNDKSSSKKNSSANLNSNNQLDAQSLVNGELNNSDLINNSGKTKAPSQKSSYKKKKQQLNDLSKNSSPNLSAATISPLNNTTITTPSSTNTKSNQKHNFNQTTDSISYASDSTIEDSISSFDSLQKSTTPTTAKRTRPPGKRKIKEKIDLDYFVDDALSVTQTSTKSSTTEKTPKRKYNRTKNNTQNCPNKELLEWKIELQEKQRLNPDQPNYFSNTPSTSSASEAELAEKPEFSGAQFHNYDSDKKYRDHSPDYHDEFVKSSYFNDVFDKKQKGKKTSNKKSSFNQSAASSTTSSTKRLRLLSQQESIRSANSPTFLSTPLITIPPGYSTPSRKSFALRDGFIFSTNNEVNPNLSLLSLHALEKPIPNSVLPFWDARFVRAIHESDEVDELVHCICDFKEESGLMIQCRNCLCWSHGSCFDIEVEEQVPESYVCFACKDPKAVRESLRYTYDQEWLKEGRSPYFQFLINDNNKNQQMLEEIEQSDESIKQMLTANQILSILRDTSQILRSIRYKVNLIKENNVEQMKYWESHLDEELLEISRKQKNEDELKESNKLLDQNITQTDEMIGDIFSFSKNILDVQTDNNKSIPDNDLDDATDLINFITSTGKEDNDVKELANNNLDFNAINSKTTLPDLNNFILDPPNLNSDVDLKSMNSIINNATTANDNLNSNQLNNLSIDEFSEDKKDQKEPANRTVEEKLLEHINSEQENVMKKLELVEKKINELESECQLTKPDENSLKEDLVQFKDLIKYLYQDLDNVSRFTMI